MALCFSFTRSIELLQRLSPQSGQQGARSRPVLLELLVGAAEHTSRCSPALRRQYVGAVARSASVVKAADEETQCPHEEPQGGGAGVAGFILL